MGVRVAERWSVDLGVLFGFVFSADETCPIAVAKRFRLVLVLAIKSPNRPSGVAHAMPKFPYEPG